MNIRAIITWQTNYNGIMLKVARILSVSVTDTLNDSLNSLSPTDTHLEGK